MSIDWFTVAAQIVNFLILIWLLKKLLFRPVMNAMERRELGISGRLRQAHEQREEAEALQRKYQQRLQQLEDEKEAVMAEARQQAENEKNNLLQRLNDEMQHKKMQFKTEMRQEQRELGEQIGRSLVEKTVALSNRVLSELADQNLEQRLIERFLAHLDGLPDTEQVAIKQSLQRYDAVLVTRFQPDPDEWRKLQEWFEAFAPGCGLTSSQRDTLICGVSLEAGGRSWEWTIERYLNELETELIEATDKTI